MESGLGYGWTLCICPVPPESSFQGAWLLTHQIVSSDIWLGRQSFQD